MKISCPDCQASYDVNFPNLTEKGTQVKCAKCQNSFLVTPERSPVSHSDSSLPNSSGEEDHKSENQKLEEDNLDDMLDQLIDEEHESNDENEDSSDPDPELDNMLDDLISGDMQSDTEEAQESSADPDDSAGPELDNMLDELISDEKQTSTEEGPEETPLDLGDGK